jgi:hypothetical protein
MQGFMVDLLVVKLHAPVQFAGVFFRQSINALRCFDRLVAGVLSHRKKTGVS